MKLTIKYDQLGFFEKVSIDEITVEELLTIKVALEQAIDSEEKLLSDYEKSETDKTMDVFVDNSQSRLNELRTLLGSFVVDI